MASHSTGFFVRQCAITAVAVMMWCAGGWAQIPPARTIVLSGSEPPDQPVGVIFADFSPNMAPSGRIAVNGTLTGAGITADNDTGVWAAGSDSVLVTIAWEGTAAPGFPDLTLSGILSTVYPSARGVAYISFLSGPGVTMFNNMASFSGGSLVHRFEGQAPGFGPDVTWDGAVTDTQVGGQLLVLGPLSGPGIDATNDDILYLWSEGNFTQLLRLGDPADGGGTFADISVERAFNRNRIIAFKGAAEEPPGVFTNGLWVGSNGSYQLVAKVGQTIATPVGSQTLETVPAVPSLDEAGQFIAFVGQVSGGVQCLWVFNGPGLLRPVAMEGEPIGGVTVMSLWAPVISGDSVAFKVLLAVFGEAIVLDTSAGQTVVAKEGDAPPGAPPGTAFSGFFEPAINSLGQVVFEAQFDGTESGEGIWLWTSDGELRPVAITGQPMWISSSDMRTPTGLGFQGGAAYNAGQGGSVSLTDNGLIVFTALFDGGVKAILTSDPENIGIWATGFETGDLSGWSSSTP
ncbi:MAG: choice-of-anchor tandem repeat NxxGxxAF-containing protein [Thermoanaerobaculales bacterium]|jgi:hypothetical protein|nr:choice-of-anchor tandem repeat NxxGxxAF-containing protein [Thermoanaerobaculales bacterium]